MHEYGYQKAAIKDRVLIIRSETGSGKSTTLPVEIFRILKPGGKLLSLQPNYRFSSNLYWDCYDHHIALSDKSFLEATSVIGFKPLLVIPKFLPFTTKSKLPKNNIFIRGYLMLPILWKIFGKQFFIINEKPLN